jgi:GNAT superfamily N-acetyltransferase
MRAAIESAGREHRDLLLAADVFDGPARPGWLDAFLDDPRHHLFVATDGGACVGFLSAVDLLHPDKPPSMWINELGGNETHRRRGLATRLVAALVAQARASGCRDVWVVSAPTEEARGFYASLGWSRTGSDLAMFTLDLGDGDG